MSDRPARRTVVLVLTAALLLPPSAASAAEEAPAGEPKLAIELGAPFPDDAILQRQMPLPVWDGFGTAYEIPGGDMAWAASEEITPHRRAVGAILLSHGLPTTQREAEVENNSKTKI